MNERDNITGISANPPAVSLNGVVLYYGIVKSGQVDCVTAETGRVYKGVILNGDIQVVFPVKCVMVADPAWIIPDRIVGNDNILTECIISQKSRIPGTVLVRMADVELDCFTIEKASAVAETG